ncbi:MAG: hypothetical protein J5738_01125 [Lachnospiraceae bacterium]|nr:hypothetical protein [Lachnospiraceae bacterium]MBO4668343.1 hypothetical protein [Lachnospiraceae bacterium]MBR5667192.1 hypothetical protein [Lachnospiraceae bacterium]
MPEGRPIVIGFDLSPEMTQIAVSRAGEEPESVSVSSTSGQFLIPTVLCVRNDSGDWLFGEEAIRCKNRNAGVFIDDLLGKAEREESVYIRDVEYTPRNFLERFFRKIMVVLRQKYTGDSVEHVVVSMRDPSDKVIQMVTDALETTGIRREHIRVRSHLQNFMFYAVCQKKELWVNDVGLFEFNENGLTYTQLSTAKKIAPITVTAQITDLSTLLDSNMLETMPDNQLAYCFRTITDKVLYRQILSTIYVTGKGFEGAWSDEVLKALVAGRRVFKGMNLYAKGAAYYGLYENAEDMRDFLFLTEDMIRSTIAIRMFKDNQIADYPMVRAGTRWSEVNAKTVGILDDTEEVYFTIYHTVKKDSQHVVMSLKNLHGRENKTTRVSIGIRCLDRETAVITVKDLGFGHFYPNTYRVWEKIVTI